jgi:hypothetical protein
VGFGVATDGWAVVASPEQPVMNSRVAAISSEPALARLAFMYMGGTYYLGRNDDGRDLLSG